MTKKVLYSDTLTTAAAFQKDFSQSELSKNRVSE
jgi:hypothetical protein